MDNIVNTRDILYSTINHNKNTLCNQMVSEKLHEYSSQKKQILGQIANEQGCKRESYYAGIISRTNIAVSPTG